MRLTVLGKSPAWTDAGGACSGYLVEDGETSLLLDCGNGVFGKLRGRCDHARLDAVVVSHLHADHVLDLVPFAYALLLGAAAERRVRPKPRLIAPPGGAAFFRRLVGTWGGETLIEDAFVLEEYAEDSSPEVGSIRLGFREVPHFVQTFAVSLEGARERLVFSADCGPTDQLVAFARDADLLLAEATLTEPETEGPRGHLTASEAGDHARRAGVGRLVLTHISDELDAMSARSAAEKAFGGQVDVAREGAEYIV